jgi:hypothetical protein
LAVATVYRTTATAHLQPELTMGCMAPSTNPHFTAGQHRYHGSSQRGPMIAQPLDPTRRMDPRIVGPGSRLRSPIFGSSSSTRPETRGQVAWPGRWEQATARSIMRLLVVQEFRPVYAGLNNGARQGQEDSDCPRMWRLAFLESWR